MTTVAPPTGLVEDIVEIARIAAPTFAEEPRIEWIERRLRGSAGSRRRDAAGNLLWTWGDGSPRLLLTAHVDTVFAAEIPLEVRAEGDRLAGPGVGDNAAAVAVAIHVVSTVLERNELAPGAVAFTVAEEGLGNLRGAHAACEALRPQAVVALEGHGLSSVVVDAVGSVRARVAARGPGGHSWSDRGSPSAIHTLVDTAGALLAHATPETPVNIGLISGGRSINTIADEAHLMLEMRALEEEPLERFAAALESKRHTSAVSISVEAVGRRRAGRLPRDSALLASIRTVRGELGLPDALESGSTDANAALALGIPAVSLGVARGGGMHTLAEWIDSSTLTLGAAQVEGVLLELLG
jgi:acetylornithine deacetylase/succinyl-diaminopimelate desuccinylase-like protein